MRIVSILLVMSLSCVVCVQEGEAKTENSAQGKQNIPTTLAEAHAELERTLSAEELAKIDAMPSEKDMIQYHFGLGTGIRNSWGLWQGGPLAKHLRELGFTHPDDMSGVILDTFWCKRHGQDFRLKERAEHYREFWDAQKKAQEGVQKSNAAIRNMMMGLCFEKQEVPVVKMPIKSGMGVRFICPFRGGVFLTAYCQGGSGRPRVHTGAYYVDPADGEVRWRPNVDDCVVRGFRVEGDRESLSFKPGDDFYTLGFHLDLTDRTIRRICVEEVNEVYASVVAGDRAWFAGLTDGKMVLVGVGDRDRITASLPREDEIPDLGMDGQSLLAVYSKTIYRLTDRQWTLVHSGDIMLPRSGLPPLRYGDMVFLRDEGMWETRKRLWWLTMGEYLQLRLLDRDTGLFEPIVSDDRSETRIVGPPGWEEASSYCVTSKGDLWACVAAGRFLLRRSQDGNYAIAIMNNSVRFTEDEPSSTETDQRVSVSAVTVLPDDTLLLAGNTGLYRLKGNELVQELAFTRDPVVDASGRVYANSWTPSQVLMLDGRSYVLGTAMGNGAYLLHQGDDGQWNCEFLEHSSEPVVW